MQPTHTLFTNLSDLALFGLGPTALWYLWGALLAARKSYPITLLTPFQKANDQIAQCLPTLLQMNQSPRKSGPECADGESKRVAVPAS